MARRVRGDQASAARSASRSASEHRCRISSLRCAHRSPQGYPGGARSAAPEAALESAQSPQLGQKQPLAANWRQPHTAWSGYPFDVRQSWQMTPPHSPACRPTRPSLTADRGIVQRLRRACVPQPRQGRGRAVAGSSAKSSTGRHAGLGAWSRQLRCLRGRHQRHHDGTHRGVSGVSIGRVLCPDSTVVIGVVRRTRSHTSRPRRPWVTGQAPRRPTPDLPGHSRPAPCPARY